MIVNPFDSPMATVPGTRLLVEDFGLLGATFGDIHMEGRNWTVLNVLKPVYSRPNKGLRARCLDQFQIVSFIEQQDLELLLYRAKPGELCPWTMDHYPEIGDEKAGWRGLFMEGEDYEDDLHLRELELRQERNWEVLPPMEVTRYLHTSANNDVARLDMLLHDYDPETGLGPDTDIATINRRWVKVEQEPLTWATQ